MVAPSYRLHPGLAWSPAGARQSPRNHGGALTPRSRNTCGLLSATPLSAGSPRRPITHMRSENQPVTGPHPPDLKLGFQDLNVLLCLNRVTLPFSALTLQRLDVSPLCSPLGSTGPGPTTARHPLRLLPCRSPSLPCFTAAVHIK